MRTTKIVVAAAITLAWTVFAIAQLLHPISIAILAGLSAGFSVGCMLSYWTYFDPNDESGQVWAEHDGTPKFYIAVISIGTVLLYYSITQASGLPLVALMAYIVPVYAIGRIRPATPSPQSPDLDDQPNQPPVEDDWPKRFFDTE